MFFFRWYCDRRDLHSFPTRRSSDLECSTNQRMRSAFAVMPSTHRSRSTTHALRSSARLPNSRYARSEEHTSELQSRFDLVCRLLLEKKKQTYPATLRQAVPCVAHHP